MAKSQRDELALLEAAIHAAIQRQDQCSSKGRRASRVRTGGIPAISALEGALCLIGFPLAGIVLKIAVLQLGLDQLALALPFWLSS